eukprot:767973-Hanusia_phi.AAC.7
MIRAADVGASATVPQDEKANSLEVEVPEAEPEVHEFNSSYELHYHETSLSESMSSNDDECKVQLTSVLARAGVGITFTLSGDKILVHGILKNGGAARARRVPKTGDALVMIEDEPCCAASLQELDEHFDRHKSARSLALTLEDSSGSRYTSICEKSHPDIHVRHVNFDLGHKQKDLQLIESRIMGHMADHSAINGSGLGRQPDGPPLNAYGRGRVDMSASSSMLQTSPSSPASLDISRIEDILFRERLLQEDLKLYHERAVRRYAWEHEERIRLEAEKDMLLRKNVEFKTRYKSARGRLNDLEIRLQDLECKYKEAIGKLTSYQAPFSVPGMVIETASHLSKRTIAPELSDDENADHVDVRLFVCSHLTQLTSWAGKPE